MHSLLRRHGFDILFCTAIMLFAVVVHYGRVGHSFDGVHLTTDAANYAAMAAGMAHPEAFHKDDALSDPAFYSVHATIFVPLISRLADNDNYGLAYLKLTGIHVFLHLLTYYILGRKLFAHPWQAVLFTLLMAQVYWIPWGTYWGAGYTDYTPRTTFSIFYPLYIVAALAILHKPRWWPVFMAAMGGMVYVHAISTLPVAIGFLLGFLWHRPVQTSRIRHFVWICLSGGCFLLTASAFIISFGRGIALTHEDVDMLRQVLIARYNPEYTYYWQGLWDFILYFCKLPLIPLALVFAFVVQKWGNAQEKELLGQCGFGALGMMIVAGMYFLDQEIARILHRHHYEFDFVRVLRFTLFFCICVSFLGINMLIRISKACSWQRHCAWSLWAALAMGLFFGGEFTQAKQSLHWFWHRLDPARYEQAYGTMLLRTEMIAALKQYTEPGASIFYPHEDLAIRHNALRSLPYSWKDVGAFYYAKNIDKLRRWNELYTFVTSSPTAYINGWAITGADYLLSDRPEDRALLEETGEIIWSNAQYILVKPNK